MFFFAFIVFYSIPLYKEMDSRQDHSDRPLESWGAGHSVKIYKISSHTPTIISNIMVGIFFFVLLLKIGEGTARPKNSKPNIFKIRVLTKTLNSKF